jgi:hypothetical protein
VHAFWIDDANDLYWSRARVDQLSESNAWTTSQLIASSVVDYSGAVDEQGVIHLTYQQNELSDGLAAGIIYQSLQEGEDVWSSAIPLFQSPYMRGLDAANSNVELATTQVGDGVWVYVTWDNRLRKNVYLTRSINGGVDWDAEPLLVDSPDPGAGSTIPFNLEVAAFEENALLVWQRGQPGENCSIYYRWSGDGGNSWSDRKAMLENIQGCPEELNFIGTQGEYVLLQATFLNQVLIQAWDGTKWSNPQLQSQISSFEDPETFGVLDFECLRFSSNPLTGKISLIGCDSTGGDIWFTERDIGDTTTWYPPPPVWADPVAVSITATDVGTPVLVGGKGEMMHAFWSQLSEGSNTSTPETSIYYARWDGVSWSRPYSILNSTEGSARQPAVALDQDDHLLAVWSESDSGLIYFSKADASTALRGSDWSLPEPLPSPVPAARSPHILSVGAGQIYVTYAVPLNEARGIYLTISEDSGITWTRPLRIFDAAGADWDMVDAPHLARSEDGSLHAVFTRYSVAGRHRIHGSLLCSF